MNVVEGEFVDVPLPSAESLSMDGYLVSNVNSVGDPHYMNAFVHRVVVADDDPHIRALVKGMLTICDDIEVIGEAENGRDAVEVSQQVKPDVVIMDVEMPLLDGPGATRAIVNADPSIRVLAHTGHTEGDSVLGMIVAGAVGYAIKGSGINNLADAIRKAASRTAVVDSAALPGLFDRLLEMTREERDQRQQVEELASSLEQMLDDTICALAAALHQRDGYTGDHDDRVASLCERVGMRMGLSGDKLRDLRFGGILHDVGKIGVPDQILQKDRPLEDDEWAIVKQHTIFGEQIIRPVTFLNGASRIVRSCHEHWDGSGYPDSLYGDDIPLESRIVLACDAYDAITTDRTYQSARTSEEAIAILHEMANVHFDPQVVDALVMEIRNMQEEEKGRHKADPILNSSRSD